MISAIQSMHQWILSSGVPLGYDLIALNVVLNIIAIPLYLLIYRANQKNAQQSKKMKKELEDVESFYHGRKKYYQIKELRKRYGIGIKDQVLSFAGLGLQLSILIAAYFYLRDLEIYDSAAFFSIKDLSQQDSLIGKLNLLPILMFIINIATNKLDNLVNASTSKAGYISSFVFLVLLYPMPAFLLVFWTAGSVFSLAKGMVQLAVGGRVKILWKYIASVYAGFINGYVANKTLILRSILLLSLMMHAFVALSLDLSSPFNKNFVLVGLYFLALLSLAEILAATNRKKPSVIFALVVAGILAAKEYWHLSPLANILMLLTIQLAVFKGQGLGFDRLLFWKHSIWKRISWRSNLLYAFLGAIVIFDYFSSNPDYFNVNSLSLFLVGAAAATFLIFTVAEHLCLSLAIHEARVPAALALFIPIFLMPKMGVILDFEIHQAAYIRIAAAALLLSAFLYFFKQNASLFQKTLLVISCLTLLLSGRKIVQEKLSIDLKLISQNKLFTMKHTPDIYFLIFDGYLPGQYMKSLYGIDNSEQENFLEENGFILSDNAYSLGRQSVTSMTSVMSMHTEHKFIAQEILNYNGYETYAVYSEYFHIRDFTFKDSINFPEVANKDYLGVRTLLNGIIEGVFSEDTKPMFQKNTITPLVENKWKFIEKQTSNPKFLYAHIYRPGHHHLKSACKKTRYKWYHIRTKQANNWMKEEIAKIHKASDDPLIVIMGDHGGYMKGDCGHMNGVDPRKFTRTELDDRYRAFFAIKWPSWVDEKYKRDSQIEVIQQAWYKIYGAIQGDDAVFHAKIKMDAIQELGKCQVPIKDGRINCGKNKGELF